MKSSFRFSFLSLLLGLFIALPSFAWVRDSGPICADGTVSLTVKLGVGPADATNTALSAVALWNPYMKRVQLSGLTGSEGVGTKANNVNEVFFDSAVYGKAFDNGVLAITYTRYNDTTRYESDVIVNNAKNWSAYSGYWQSNPGDLRRVLAHEFGHVLGLDHPDEHSQSVDALMNSHVGWIESPMPDDQTGVATLYGATAALKPRLDYISPSSVYAYEGEDIYIGVSYGSILPCTFTWIKDGVDLPANNSSNLVIKHCASGDAGSYQVRITNDAGSVTSSICSVTVNKETAPTVNVPSDATIEVGQDVNFYGWVNSHSSYTLQWNKDGSPITGATNSNLSLTKVKLTDAGLYSLSATNKAGTTTSQNIRLTVNPARPPQITNQPRSMSTWAGNSASFYVSYSGSDPVTIVWYKDDVVMPGNTYSNLNINSVKREDAGSYKVTITNVAGSVTSTPAILEVTPPPVPTISIPISQYVQVGSSLNLWASTSQTVPSMSFQWYKNGTAIPGATYSSYSAYNLTAADAGEYIVILTTPRGVSTSNGCTVYVTASTTKPSGAWQATCRLDDVVYFGYANPARIESYDLKSGTWLSSMPLSSAVTALCAGNGRLYIACGLSLYRFEPGASSAQLLTSTLASRTTGLCWLNGRLVAYQNDGGYYGAKLKLLNPDDGSSYANSPTVDSYYISPTLVGLPDVNKVFTTSSGISPADVQMMTFTPDFASYTFKDSPYHGDFNIGSKLYLSKDGTKLFNNTGPIYSTSDLTYVGNLGSFDDLCFDETGNPVALLAGRLQLFDGEMRPKGFITLGSPADTLFVRAGIAYAFSYPASGAQSMVQTVNLSSATDTPVASINPEGLFFVPDSIDVDADGNLLLLSRLKKHVFRWDTTARKYASTHFPLHGTPGMVAVAPALNRMYLSYDQALVRQLDLANPAAGETFFAQVSERVDGLAAAGPYILINDPSGAWSADHTYNKDGVRLSRKEWVNPSIVYVWLNSKHRMYKQNQGIEWQEILADGTLGQNKSFYYTQDSVRRAWATPGEDALLTDRGTFIDTETILENNHLAITTLTDAAWLKNRLYTVRDSWDGCTIERWGGNNYGKDASAVIEGRPLRLLTLPSGRLLLVLMRGPRLYFAQLDESLATLSLDGTGTVSSVSNLSARAEAGVNDNTLTPSFVIEGSQPKRIIIRAVGPTLKNFGLANPIPDPLITVFNDKRTAVAGNDNWGSVVNLADLTSTSDRLGAFALNAGSKDSALLLTLNPGAYTVQVSDSKSTIGPAIAEVYDADEGTGSSKLSNMALRGKAGSGDTTLIGGFVISGSSPRTLLVRGIGPTLAKFGVSGALADPVLKIFAQGNDTPIYTNDNWGGAQAIIDAATKTGAFALDANTKDACLLVTLNPGAYTAHLVSADSSTGVGLLELYLMPE